MKISRNTKLRFLGFSIVLLVALGMVVNMVAANSGQVSREEVSSVNVPSGAQAEETPDMPQFTQTSCAMAIDDLGDNNPFTYSFSAVNVNNIASYSWDFGDSTTASTQVAPKTYATAGTFPITLTCTPTGGFGAPIVLTGSVFVSQPPTVGFSLLPGTTVTNNGAVVFSTNNTTTPGTSIYEWCVTASPTPPGTFNGVNCPIFFGTTTNISFPFGVYATTHYIYLKATNAGETGIAGLSFVLNATAPSMDFTFTPASGSGPAPLNVTVNEIDNLTGPVTSIQYTLTAPGPVVTTYTSVAALNAVLVNLPAGLYTVRLDYAGPGGSGFVQRSILSYVAAEAVVPSFIVELGDMVGPNRRVCFINTSGGPVANSYWDFDGNGSPDIGDIPAITGDTPESGDPMTRVCYVYPAAVFGTNITVKLIVVGSDPVTTNAETIEIINFIAKPEASFTWNGSSPASIEWGTFASFTDTSTGVVDDWDWEFDFGNNGSIDANVNNSQTANNMQLPVGVNRVILTIRNTVTGEVDTVEHFITVTPKAITCNAIGGTFVINPDNANPQNYTMSVNGLNGVNFGTRTATFAWTINGIPVGGATSPLSGINWNTYGYGTHTLGVTVTTSDGVTCSREQTVNYDWEPVTCPDMTVTGSFPVGTAPYTFYPNDGPITFTIPSMAGTLNGRAILGYEWYVNSVLQVGETANTFVYTLPAPPASVTVRYVVLVDNNGSGLPYNPANDASCFEDEAFTVASFPTVTCNIPNPGYGTIYADGISRNITVNATAGTFENRTITAIRLYSTRQGSTENLIGTATFPPETGTGYTFPWTNHTIWNPSAPDWSFRAEVDVTDGVTTYTSTPCTRGVAVTDYPTPTCSITGGSAFAPNSGANLMPVLAGTTSDQHDHTFNMNFSLLGLGGITTGTRTWTYPVNAPATILSGGGLGDNTVEVQWNANQASLPTGTPASIDLTVNWTYPDLTPGSLICTGGDVAIVVPKLVCDAPTGDLTPLPLDNNTYNIALTNVGGGTNSPLYGRNHFTQWRLERYIGVVGGPYDVNNDALWTPVGGSPFTTASTPASQNLNYALFTAGDYYRIRYYAEIPTDLVLDNCTSPWVLLTTTPADTSFTCDTYYGSVVNSFVVADPFGNQTITLNVDNGNRYNLQYEFYLVGANGIDTPVTPIHTATSTNDGNVSFNIARSLFAPGGNVGNYNMRVVISYVDQGLAASPPAVVPINSTCASPQRYIVGAVDANMVVDPYGGGRSGFAVGECFNIANTSATNSGLLFGSAVTNLVYQWVIGGGGTPANNNQGGLTTFTTFEPFNPDPAQLCLNDNGTYTMSLRARNIDGGDVAFRQENTQVNNIRICDLQSLSIPALTNFTPGNKTFNVSFLGELTGNYTFTLINTDTMATVHTSTQASNSYTRNIPAGNYRLDVSRNGCLGVASASYNFTILGGGGIAASYRFLNNINTGPAGTTICFIDTSTTNGGSLNSWAWDFEPFVPDGVFEVTAPGNPNPCFQFNTPGVYRPRLRVGNTSGQFATAQNPVRIYTVLEGQMSFTSTPQGGGAWCFTPNLSNAPAGTIVNYWEFDANQLPSPTQTPAVGANGAGVICHTYGLSGTYYVNMCFTGPGPTFETGCVTNTVVVDLPGANPPTLAVTPTCSAGGTAQFNVVNNGPGAMPNTVTALFYRDGVLFDTRTVNALTFPGSQNFSFPGMDGDVVRIVIGAYGIDVNTTCPYQPILTVTAVCSGTSPSYPTFTLNNAVNAGGTNPMLVTQSFTVFDGATPVHTGNLPTLPTGASSQVIPITWAGTENPYATYRIESTGTYGTITFTIASPCNTVPVLSVARDCANPTQFTINSTLPLLFPQSFQVVGTSITGVIPAGVGGTPLVVALTGLNPYLSYNVVTTTTTNGYLTLNGNLPACTPPTLNVTRDCATPDLLTITSSAPLLFPQSIQVVGTSITGVIPAGVGGTPYLVALTGINPYLSYTVVTTTTTNGYLTLNAVLPACTPPTLNVTRDCATPDLLTITSSAPLLFPQSIQVVGTSITGVIPAGVGGTPYFVALTGLNPYASYTVVTTTATNGYLTLNAVLPACTPPTLTATRDCANPTTITVTSTGTAFLPQGVEVQGTSISGTVPAGTNTSTVLTLTGNPYLSYTIVTNTAPQGYLTLNSVLTPCSTPALTVTRTCANPTTITVSTVGGVPLPTAQDFIVVEQPSVTGSIPVNGNSVILTLATFDPYADYTVQASGGFISYTSTPTNCARPVLTIVQSCVNPMQFIVTNTGANMLLPSTVTYNGPGGSTVSPTSVNLLAGQNTTLTVNPSAPTIDPYAAYSVTINDFNTNSVAVTDVNDCNAPVLSVTNNNCATYPLTFTVSNTGGDMLVGQTYEIRNSGGTLVQDGILLMNAGGNQIITMLPSITPYGTTYTISTSGYAGSFSVGSDTNMTCTAPVLTAVSDCAYPATFTITNTGGDMLTPQSFAITHKDGTNVTGSITPAVTNFDLNNGQQLVLTLDTALDPYGLYTLSSTGFAGNVTNTQDCELPQLQVSSSCVFPVQFLVKNVGADMPIDHTFSVTNAIGFDLTPAPGTFRLATDEVYLVNIPVTDLSQTITFASNTFGIFNITQITCISGGGVVKNPPIVDLGNTPPTGTSPISPETLLLNRLSLDLLGLPAWSGVPTCGHGCPIFRLYHTNQSGDWDVWRLDGADMESRTSFHTNLTERDSADASIVNAENVTDIAPSLSPNNEWFVFSSNRDGNWEIYVAPTDGDLNAAQRVTFNETAIDTDPTWGPNNFIVYESSRMGNWDLFMVDAKTGIEYQVTDSPSNELNPAWSPDGSKIVYQSDVNSSPLVVDWQIFEIDLGTMTVRRLTSEAFGAVDPSYSPDGNRIVYRTHTAMTNSVIKVMNGDLSGMVAVTGDIENATTPVFSPSGRYLAYQSNADGDLDIYVHEFATGLTRKLTDNTIDDFAPTWLCGDDRLVFTSEIYGQPDIFEVDVEPISAGPILVEEDAFQLTFEDFDDVYPLMNQPEENASREDQKVVEDTQYQRGLFRNAFSMTPLDLSDDTAQRADWAELDVCPAASDFAIGGG